MSLRHSAEFRLATEIRLNATETLTEGNDQ